MDEKDQIKDRINLAELLGEYLEVKPAGTHAFKALCPFHGEKTPSLHISNDKQIWHCFGCSEGGDCFSFVMKMEGMDFSEALRHLGKKVGIEVKRYSSTKGNLQHRLSDINELAAKFYSKVLEDSKIAENTRDYLKERGITKELQEIFVLGYAPDAWDTLAQFLKKRGYSDYEGQQAGLLLKSKKGTGMIDRFRNRLMIPLRDQHGNTVGFTGRSIPGGQDPKYMNSPETPIYHKSRLLYGLEFAKSATKQSKSIIIVEGNLDIIASHKAGIKNIVASSGTALTEDQLNLLKRYTNTLIFSFDQDAAGFAAAQKGIQIARKLGFDIRVAVLKDVKDPDEAVQKDPKIWRQAVSNTIPIMQYYIDRAIEGKDLSKIEDKKEIGRFLLPELAQIQDVVEREHWLQLISDLLKTDINILRQSISSGPGPDNQKKAKVSTLSGPVPDTRIISKNEQAGMLVIGTFIQDQKYRLWIKDHIRPEQLPENLQTLYKKMISVYDHGQLEPGQESLFSRLRNQLEKEALDLMPLLNEISLRAQIWFGDIPENKIQDSLKQLISLLSQSAIKDRRLGLISRIRQAELLGDKDTVQKLIHEYNQLN